MDLTLLTLAELEAHRLEVINEQERRQDADRLPALIEQLSARYKKATGQAQPPISAAERGVGGRPA